MENLCKLTTRKYVGLVCNLNARTAQMPPLFQESQQLDESELVDSIANKAPRTHKDMPISQGFNPKTGDLETFVVHSERAGTTDNISGAKFAASDEEINTKNKKKCLNFKGQDEHGKKRQKIRKSCISIYMVKTPVTPPGSTKSLKRKARKILIIPQRITRGSPGK